MKFHREWNKILIRDSIRDCNKINLFQRRDINISNEPTHDKNLSTQEQLRRWAFKYNISKGAVTTLLKILISFGLIWLPSDSRTLFSTPRNMEIDTLSQGHLWYNGIKKNLEMIFANVNRMLNIGLFFNMDGLPIFNSNKYEFWPILGKIVGKYIEFSLQIK